MTESLKRRAAFIAIVIAVGVAADQALKALAASTLKGASPIPCLGGFVLLRWAQNKGAILGMGGGLSDSWRTALFTVGVAIVVPILVVFAIASRDSHRLERWAIALVAAGGIGNLIDRVALGYVRDYVVLGGRRLNTGVFNLADVAVTVGGVLLVVHLIRSWKDGRSARSL